jgi:hypothetical protein
MRYVCAVLVCLVCASCGSTEPSPVASLTIGNPSPASGAVQVTGSFIPKDSGRLAIPITVTSDREVPWAQLNVYLLTNDNPGGYCAQNLPDAPTWGPFRKGQTESVTITGFQTGRVPCQVTGIRAFLHTRNSGLLTPPTSSETVTQGTRSVTWTLE